MSKKTVNLAKLTIKQDIILKNRKRNNFLLSSRRSGKTTFCERLAAEEAIKYPNRRVAWSAPTWKLMIETFERHKSTLLSIIKRINREDRRIELINGSVIEYWSSDDPSAGRGRKYHIWISDETQRQRKLNEFIKASVRPCLADYRGELWILGTPNGVGSDFHELWLECENSEKENPGTWNFAKIALEDNPYIHPDEIKQMRQDMGFTVSRQEIDAEWVKIDGIAPLIHKLAWDDLYEVSDKRRSQKVMVVDGSLSGDTTSIIGVWKDLITNEYYVDYEDIHVFDPQVTEHMMDGQIDFAVVENVLMHMWETNRFMALGYDPYQMVSLAQRLKRRGVRTIEFTQNAQRIKADSYLRQVLNDGLLHHPDHPELNEHVLNATIKYSPQNTIRIVKSQKSKRIDLSVCLSMAVYLLNTMHPSSITEYSAAVGNIRQENIVILNQPTINIVGNQNPFDFMKNFGGR